MNRHGAKNAKVVIESCSKPLHVSWRLPARLGGSPGQAGWFSFSAYRPTPSLFSISRVIAVRAAGNAVSSALSDSIFVAKKKVFPSRSM